MVVSTSNLTIFFTNEH